VSAREWILDAVRRNQPPATPLPEVTAFGPDDTAGDAADTAGAVVGPAESNAGMPGKNLSDYLLERFTRAAADVGVEVVTTASTDELEREVTQRHPDAKRIASTVPEPAVAYATLDPADDPHDLADVDVLLCRAALGVAENGAVWLPASALGHRAAPFLAQHVVVLLDPDRIVADLHEAYARLDVAADGFGLFMAGPSKTADIEQSLVIGAHGPRSVMIVVTRKG
jgi:L-lactate dehydrogenase complex protein LldG